MYNHIIGIDSVAIAVRDLDRAAAIFRGLGFTLTPRGHDLEWGVSDYCVMFGQDHIQLLAAESTGTEADHVRDFAARREGAMELSFNADDAEAASDALVRAGIKIGPVRTLSRRLDAPDQPILSFAEAALPASAAPGIDARLIQHHSNERERFPEWLDHPNGAIAIASITAVVEAPIDLTSAWDILFGPHATTPTDNTVTVHTGRGVVFLTRPEDLSQLHPDAEAEEAPEPPAIVALALQVADTDRAARVLTEGGIEHSRDREGTVRIPPSAACGLFLELIGG